MKEGERIPDSIFVKTADVRAGGRVCGTVSSPVAIKSVCSHTFSTLASYEKKVHRR